jgi:predicted transcriptional regulator
MDDDEKTQRDVGQHLVATVVSSYVKHNTVSADALPTVIASVHQALSCLGKASLPVGPLAPARRRPD